MNEIFDRVGTLAKEGKYLDAYNLLLSSVDFSSLSENEQMCFIYTLRGLNQLDSSLAIPDFELKAEGRVKWGVQNPNDRNNLVIINCSNIDLVPYGNSYISGDTSHYHFRDNLGVENAVDLFVRSGDKVTVNVENSDLSRRGYWQPRFYMYDSNQHRLYYFSLLNNPVHDSGKWVALLTTIAVIIGGGYNCYQNYATQGEEGYLREALQRNSDLVDLSVGLMDMWKASAGSPWSGKAMKYAIVSPAGEPSICKWVKAANGSCDHYEIITTDPQGYPCYHNLSADKMYEFGDPFCKDARVDAYGNPIVPELLPDAKYEDYENKLCISKPSFYYRTYDTAKAGTVPFTVRTKDGNKTIYIDPAIVTFNYKQEFDVSPTFYVATTTNTDDKQGKKTVYVVVTNAQVVDLYNFYKQNNLDMNNVSQYINSDDTRKQFMDKMRVFVNDKYKLPVASDYKAFPINLWNCYNRIGIKNANHQSPCRDCVDICVQGRSTADCAITLGDFAYYSLTFHNIPTVDRNKCNGCGKCIKRCEQKVFTLT